MAAVILPWADAVEQFIIDPAQLLPPSKVFKNPLLKGFPDHLLLLLGDHGLRLIEDSLFLPVLCDGLIVYLGVTQVQCVLQKPVGIYPARPVSGSDKGIPIGIQVLP